jgi:hypothetical protein
MATINKNAVSKPKAELERFQSAAYAITQKIKIRVKVFKVKICRV